MPTCTQGLRVDQASGKPMRYETTPLLVAYLWSHYSDLWEDEEANTAYGEWARLITASPGFSLDAGCAVGRFGFELTERRDFVVGLDLSRSFIRVARDLAQKRGVDFSAATRGIARHRKLLHRTRVVAL